MVGFNKGDIIRLKDEFNTPDKRLYNQEVIVIAEEQSRFPSLANRIQVQHSSHTHWVSGNEFEQVE